MFCAWTIVKFIRAYDSRPTVAQVPQQRQPGHDGNSVLTATPDGNADIDGNSDATRTVELQ